MKTKADEEFYIPQPYCKRHLYLRVVRQFLRGRRAAQLCILWMKKRYGGIQGGPSHLFPCWWYQYMRMRWWTIPDVRPTLCFAQKAGLPLLFLRLLCPRYRIMCLCIQPRWFWRRTAFIPAFLKKCWVIICSCRQLYRGRTIICFSSLLTMKK